jgi:hypothetical protein
MRATVLVELSPTLDADEWARRHAGGEVPDRVPYGLDERSSVSALLMNSGPGECMRGVPRPGWN